MCIIRKANARNIGFQPRVTGGFLSNIRRVARFTKDHAQRIVGIPKQVKIDVPRVRSIDWFRRG